MNPRHDPPGIHGPVRLHYRTKQLLLRLRPGEIAVIDHPNLDRAAADALVACGVRAVLNAAASMSSTFPNRGPARLLQAAVPHLDELGPSLFTELKQGDVVGVLGEALFYRGRLLTRGRCWTPARLERARRRARRAYTATFRAFVRNTTQHARTELDHFPQLVAPGRRREPELAGLAATVAGRPVLVVGRGPGHLDDLPLVLAVTRGLCPVVFAVDGAADALMTLDVEPHAVIGDMDSVSDDALRAAPCRIVHAYPDGGAPGLRRIRSLNLEARLVPAPGTSEDLALALAGAWGARPIVLVGGHRHPVDFLEKGRSGMGSTLLTRLALGPRLVDLSGLEQAQGHHGRRTGRRGYWRTVERWPAVAVALVLVGMPVAGLMAVAPIWQNMLRVGWFYVRVLAMGLS